MGKSRMEEGRGGGGATPYVFGRVCKSCEMCSLQIVKLKSVEADENKLLVGAPEMKKPAVAGSLSTRNFLPE